MPGLVPASRFFHSQFPCRLYKSPLDETINRGPPCVYIYARRSDQIHTVVNDLVVDVRVRWIMTTLRYIVCTNHCQSLKSVRVFKIGELDTIRKKKKKKVQSRRSSGLGDGVTEGRLRLDHFYGALGHGLHVLHGILLPHTPCQVWCATWNRRGKHFSPSLQKIKVVGFL